MQRICPYCGNVFSVNQYHKKFCSAFCRNHLHNDSHFHRKSIPTPKSYQFTKINSQAKKFGLSFGKFITLLYSGHIKNYEAGIFNPTSYILTSPLYSC